MGTRDCKGISINKHADDYCVVDLETTGVRVGFSDIIEISSIKVRNNKVVDEFSTLVNPCCHIPAEATAVNHITDDMVASAPCLEEVLNSFLSFVGNDIILGYNNAAFDMNLIYDSALEINGIPFQNNYIDLLHIARRNLDGLINYKLETLSQHYGFDTIGEHRALKDCYLTKDCYDALYEEFGDKAFVKREKTYSGVAQYSTETTALRELQELLKRIIHDGILTFEEVGLLCEWTDTHRDLKGTYLFDRVDDALNRVFEDGKVSESELKDLQDIFQKALNPVEANQCCSFENSIKDKHFCLTGEFLCYETKSEVEQVIAQKGGIVDNNVKKTTNYLIVGGNGSTAWTMGNYGGKIQKAMQYNSKGTDIKIIKEVEFIEWLARLEASKQKEGE